MPIPQAVSPLDTVTIELDRPRTLVYGFREAVEFQKSRGTSLLDAAIKAGAGGTLGDPEILRELLFFGLKTDDESLVLSGIDSLVQCALDRAERKAKFGVLNGLAIQVWKALEVGGFVPVVEEDPEGKDANPPGAEAEPTTSANG